MRKKTALTATYAVIPAAGRAVRFNTEESAFSTANNKMYAELCGFPLLHWTVSAFSRHHQVDGIVVVAAANQYEHCRKALDGLPKILSIIRGGESRQESVYQGLLSLPALTNDIVLIHDGARPMVDSEIIDRCIQTARSNGNAVAGIPLNDTVKRSNGLGQVTETLDRSNLWSVQTPQAFQYTAILTAHQRAIEEEILVTDDAALIEITQQEPVNLVYGSTENFKVTRKADLMQAESIIRQRNIDLQITYRTGFGYDIHRLVEGRSLVIGGVIIPNPSGRGLLGHSDADVLLHALCDALLGAAGMPDIGTLYPNTDPTFEGIASTELLADVIKRLNDSRFKVVSVDTTVVAESPKISSYIPQMRSVISKFVGIGTSDIGIKATTNEGLGALGAGEGISAYAVASVRGLSRVEA